MENQKQATDYTLEQLKAMAYDELVVLERAKANITAIENAMRQKAMKRTEVLDTAEVQIKEKKK